VTVRLNIPEMLARQRRTLKWSRSYLQVKSSKTRSSTQRLQGSVRTQLRTMCASAGATRILCNSDVERLRGGRWRRRRPQRGGRHRWSHTFVWAGTWLVDLYIYRHRFLKSAGEYLGIPVSWRHPVPLGDPYFDRWLERHPEARRPLAPVPPWPFKSALLRAAPPRK
jgi:hypothetical protein